MKKICFSLLTLLIICQSGLNLFAQSSVTQPAGGKEYNIIHSTGLLLTRSVNAESPKIQNPTGYYDQRFEFEPVSGEVDTYYIKNVYDDDYLVRTGAGTDGWSMSWVKDPTAIASLPNGKYQISILDATTDYVQIKNLGSGSMIGTDATIDGSTVYANKNGITEPKYQWKIIEYTNEVKKDALVLKRDEAKALYNATTQGTGPDQYPANTRTALKNALDDADDIIANNSADQADVNDALITLTNALQAYIDSVYPLQPDVAKTWYIIHTSGLFFGSGVNISTGSYAPDQYFKFVAVAGKTAVYNIQLVSTGNYLTRNDNGYGLSWGEDASTALAQFQIKSTGTGYYRIWCTEVSGEKTPEYSYLGTDSNDAGSGVYVDKSGQDGKHHWKFQDIIDVPVNKTALQEAIDKVAEFLQYATKGTGSDQYPAAEYDALVDAKTTADAANINANATQTQVGDATLALNNALAACIAVVNPYLPDVTKTYSIIHFGGLYFGEIDQELKIFAQSKQDNQLFKFVAVAGKMGVYNIQLASVPGKYLTRSTEPHPTEEGKYDDYKLIWGDDATTDFAQFEIKKVGNKDYHTIKCITAGPQRSDSCIGTDDTTENSGASVDKDGKNTKHYWRVIDSTETGISKVVDRKINIFSGNKQLKITELEGNNQVSIYAITGQLISKSQVNGSVYTKELSAGNYIVVVNGVSSYRGIIAIR
jgi:hypothetical protein